uniref:Multidrug resistance-associated protein 5 n=1 Tax=Tanacetum cinerariifolium TaxID=118510 RepID=A0A699H1T0_TANCI|nr:multidrug resistance-associated protein 5 [Tanacetum cinerariifolium]
MEVENEGIKARTSTTKGVKARNDTTEGVEARTSTKDKGNEKVSQDASDVVKTRRCTIEVDSETEYESYDDSDYQSDKSVDYLSPGEDEFIKLRNRMKANRKAKAKAKDKLDSEMNEPNEENSMHANNVRDGITEDPFIYVEKYMEREVRVVAKCGQRPPKVSDPEKDKQRKHTRANLDIKLCDIADLVMKKYKCKDSPNQCTNAKKYALTDYEKSIGEHYSMLKSYGKAILDSNPWFTVKLGVTVNLDGKTYFDRFCVCFSRLTDGWKAGCRKIIALDGCFLKSPNQGEILTAIRRYGNNCIYPVAWAVVNVENKDNWTWFLELLVLESYVSAWFKTNMYFVSYHNSVKQVPGMYFWPDQSMYSTVLPPKPRKIPGRPRKKRIRAIGEGGSSTRVFKVGKVRDEGASETRRGTIGFRGRGGAAGLRGGASGSIGRGADGSGGASGSRGRGTGGSRGRGAGGSERKHVSTVGTQKTQGKKKVRNSGFAKWFGLQDEPEQTQAEPQHTQHEPERTQVEDQVKETEDQAKIGMTQLEQTQKSTHD